MSEGSIRPTSKGTKTYSYQIGSNVIYAIMFGTTALALPSSPHLTGRRLSASDQAPIAWLSGIVWSTFLTCALLYEGIRFIYLLGHWKGKPKKMEGSVRGDLGASIRKAILSSATALALLGASSFGISALGCIAFTLLNYDKPTFLQKETRSFLWTVSLIHTGVASGLLTKRAFAQRVPITAPAFEVMSRSNITVIMSTILPSICGWLGVRIVAQLIKPTWQPEDIPPETAGPFDFGLKIMTMLVGMLEYFEAMGYWRSLVWCGVAALGSLFMLDFIDMSVSMTADYYRHGMVHLKKDSRDDAITKFSYYQFTNLLAQGALATGLSLGSFWQWPLNGAMKMMMYFDASPEDMMGVYSIVNH